MSRSASLRLQAAEELEELQILDLPPELGVPADGVVVGEGDDVQPALFGPAKNVEDADGLILIVGRRRGMNVKVDPPPRQVCWWRCRGGCGERDVTLLRLGA